ncbi:MAG: ABC transporter ATP-binding protein [Candidatus Woesearchaeota archaeon]|nr:MAG: ABC transporter ATP-binding protein [Candidatus Woesearchaeota archaeon]
MTEQVIKIEDLKGYYRGSFGVVHAVDGVSLSVNKGDIMGIAGESGCGKTSLAELITGRPIQLLHHEGGQVYINDLSIYEVDEEVIRKEILCKVLGYVPQASLNSLNPVKRIRAFILDAMRERVGTKAKNKQKVLDRVVEHFKKLGLEESVIDKYPHELSGGMKQRVVVGISSLWNPLILLVDEPTSALDVTTQQLLIETLMHLKKTGIVETILFISHDIPTLAQICSVCIIMYAGKIVEQASMDDIINNPQHPYTKMLINSIACFNPDGSAETRLEGIPGRPPDLKNPPKGCRFYPRCPSRLEKCKENYPPFFTSRTNSNPVACWLHEEVSH